jgi:hypothetical protein
MLACFVSHLLLLFIPIASLSLPHTDNQQQLPLKGYDHDHLRSRFRDVEFKDLAAITTVFIEAFSPSAAWHYVMPDLQYHKDEAWACLHTELKDAWRTRNTNLTIGKVITVPSRSNGHSESEQEAEAEEEDLVVSFSFWSIRTRKYGGEVEDPQEAMNPFTSFSSLAAALQSRCGGMPPGTNLTRAMDFQRQNDAYEYKYFDKAYPHQLYLKLLATHPDWDGNGFGARHVEWGQQLSLELGPSMPVTLFASPAGYPLYDSLGFESVKNATIAMLDGLGDLWFEVMSWEEVEDE